MVRQASVDQGLDEVREAAVAEWDAMAPGWERRREFLRGFSQPVTDWMVAQLAPQPGQIILELAAGPGDTGFAAARLIGEGGRLISSDLAPGMIEVAWRRAEELGVSNVEFRVLDATRTDLEPASVNGILCRWGYSLVPDVAAAFAESRRVLRPGGKLSLSVMAGPAENPWASGVARSLIGLGLIPPIDPNAPGGLFSLADHEKLGGFLRGAGFENVRIEDMAFHLRFADFDDYWRFILEFAGAVAILLNSFSEEQRTAVRDATEQGAEPFRTDQGYDFPGLTVNAIAS